MGELEVPRFVVAGFVVGVCVVGRLVVGELEVARFVVGGFVGGVCVVGF